MKIDSKKIFSKVDSFVSKRYFWFVGAELLVIFLFGWMFLLKGEWATIQESGILEYERTEQRLDDRNMYLLKLQMMEDSYNEINQERLQQLKQVLPSSYSPTAMITTMQSFAKQSGIEITSIETSEQDSLDQAASSTIATDRSGTSSSISHPNIRTVTITMNINKETGTYSELKAFLDTLESFVPVLDMKDLSFSPDSPNIALQLQTYYYQESSL